MESITEVLKTKRAYSSPEIERIKLDNEISLIMSSLAPPTEPE